MPRKKVTPETVGTADQGRDFTTIVAGVKAAQSLDPKAACAARDRANKVKAAASTLKPENVVASISGFGLTVNKTVQDIQAQLVQKLDELAMVDQAISVKKAELEELFDKEVVATELSAMVHQFEQQAQELESKEEQAQAAFTLAQQARETQSLQQAQALQESRKREQDAYEYQKQQDRRRLEDQFQERMAAQKKANTEAQEALEKDLRERESAMAAREQEFLDLQVKVQGFPMLLERSIIEAQEKATKEAKQSAQFTAALASKDHESTVKVANQTIESQANTILGLQSQITELKEQLGATSAQVQTIAIQAVQSASGRQALDAVKEVSQFTGNQATKK